MLNYDPHWNPVRLIQRFGRVDRIGTEHPVIYLHNMWPDVAVDAGLSLTERLHNRIQSFPGRCGADRGAPPNFHGRPVPQVENALSEIRELRLEGSALRTRLEALRERYRLNPPADSDRSQAQDPQVVRIVCSDGLVS